MFKRILFPFAILLMSGFLLISFNEHVYSEDKDITNQRTDLLSDIGNLLGQNWFQGLLSVLAVIVTIVVYMHEQSKIRKETLKRSCDALQREIKENKVTLTTGEYKNVNYALNDDQYVNYTNAYLDKDAYESVLFSGSFSFFTAITQHKLTMLYGRIKSYNETITYIDHFQDFFFMYDDVDNTNQSKKRLEKWYKDVSRYDLLLTKYEKEIRQLLDEVEPLIETEKGRKKDILLGATDSSYMSHR